MQQLIKMIIGISAASQPPQLRRRSSTDSNGHLLPDKDRVHWEQNSVTPSSFSDIFTGHQNVVLVKKADPNEDPFVPLPSLPPTPPTSPPTLSYVAKAPVGSTNLPSRSTAVPYTTTMDSIFVNMADDGTARLLSAPPADIKTKAEVSVVPVMPVIPAIDGPTPIPPTTPGPIVVLSRQRFLPHQDTVFVTPSSVKRITTTLTPSPSLSSTGVPASGDIPRSWTINSYDPRRNRLSSRQGNDHHNLFFSPTNTASHSESRPAFVTPLPKATTPSTTLRTESKSGHPPTSETLIAQLRRDYKKRRQWMEHQSSAVRRSDFGGPTVIPKSTSTTTEYTKGPSIRFDVVQEAEDRQFAVTTAPGYTTSYLPPITTESHAYKEVHYVESDPLPAYPTTTTAAPTPSTTLYSSTPTTTATPLLHPPPPTSLTPPFQSQPATVYTVRPTVPSSSTTLLTTQGALLLPKQKVPTFVTPIHSPLQHTLHGKAAPAIIVVQQPQQQPVTMQQGEEAKPFLPKSKPVTTTPMSTTSTTTTTTTTTTPMEDSSIVFQTPPPTPLAGLVTYDDNNDIEITERINRNGGEVVFNDTQVGRNSGGGNVQQSINLKINVIVENDSPEENEDYVDSIPKASTSPSIALKNGMVKLAPLTYISSHSFRSKEPSLSSPPAATANDYMYDSELDLDEYYLYYDDDDDEAVPEVWTATELPSTKSTGKGAARPTSQSGTLRGNLVEAQKQNLQKVELTDTELFELYDDLTEILEDMEASLVQPEPKLHSRPADVSHKTVRDEKKQNIYEFIRSKPLKMPKKTRKYPSSIDATRSPWTSPETSFKVNSAGRGSARPSSSSSSSANAKFKTKGRKRRKKNYLKMEYYPLASVKSYGPYPKTTMAPKSHYNLSSGDLIPDLRGVSKPSNWNVRDFTQWENIFYPRLGVIPSTQITPELNPSQRPRPEKQRKVTFDTLLKTNPREVSKFSRLIQHERRNRRRRIDDHFYDHEHIVVDEEPWTQYSSYRRMPRDNFYREDSALSPMPRFQISFDEWLAEAGVTSSPHWHRRKRRR